MIMFMKFGHRGAPGKPRYGENTISSFSKALRTGANALEFDVRRTKDNKIVVIHDLALNRTTNGRGNVCDFNYEDLVSLDAGYGDHIPLLAEVFDLFASSCILNIELKERGLAIDVKKTILERGISESVIVSAFDEDDNDPDSSSSWDDLAVMREEVPIGLLAQKTKIDRMGRAGYVETATRRGAGAIHPHYSAMTPNLVSLAHRAGLRVFVWTANNFLVIAGLKVMGVDGLFSDFPEKL